MYLFPVCHCSQMDKQKQQLLDAAQKKLIALSKLRVIKAVVDSNEVGDDGVDQLENIEQLFSDIGKFIDYNDTKVSQIEMLLCK